MERGLQDLGSEKEVAVTMQKAWCFRGLLTLKCTRFELHGENVGKTVKVNRV